MKDRPYVLFPGKTGDRGHVTAGRLAQLYGVRLADCVVIREDDALLVEMQLATVAEHAVHLRPVAGTKPYPDFRLRRTTEREDLVEWEGGPRFFKGLHARKPAFRAMWFDELLVVARHTGETVAELEVQRRQVTDEHVLSIIHAALLEGRFQHDRKL